MQVSHDDMVMQALVVLHTVWLRAVLFGAFWFGVSYVNLRQPHILSAKIKENPSSCIQVNTVCFILIYIQQDATIHNLFCGNCSAFFRWYHHPSSGVQTTVSTASGICHTVTATCRSNSVTNARCYRCSCLHS